MKKNSFSIGDFVQCNYRARWKGVVVSVEKVKNSINNKTYTVCEVLMLKDRCGRLTTKRHVMRRGDGWLEKVDEFNITQRQLQWLPNIVKSKVIKKGLVI